MQRYYSLQTAKLSAEEERANAKAAINAMTQKRSQRPVSSARPASQSPQNTGRAKNPKTSAATGSAERAKSPNNSGRTRNISLTNPHKVPHRHHEAEQAPSLTQPTCPNPQTSSTKPAKKLRLPSLFRTKTQEPPQMQHNKKRRAGSSKNKGLLHATSVAKSSSKPTFSKKPLSQSASHQKTFRKAAFTQVSFAKKTWSKVTSFLTTSLRFSRRLQIAVTCLVSATVFLGALGVINSCTNSAQTSQSSQGAAVGDSTSQNVMTKKLCGIAHEITIISQAINSIQADGYHVGFSTQALQGGASLGYDQNRLFYSASSIKGPYILAALENRGSVPSSQRDNIAAAIVDSDNDAYFRLVESFGIDPINAELASVGATDRLNSSDYFVHITPGQLCNLWKISASYVDSESTDNTWLHTLFAQTANSEIAKLTGAETWSKAGWIMDEDESYNATVDAGIVSRENLTYAMAVMCNKGEDFDAIAPLIQSLDALQQYFN